MNIYKSIVSRISIDKGWSGDQKYYAATADGQKYLLRISPIDRLERKRREYEKMCEVAQLGIPMCLPIEFGTCEEGAYSIQSWIDGEDVVLSVWMPWKEMTGIISGTQEGNYNDQYLFCSTRRTKLQ